MPKNKLFRKNIVREQHLFSNRQRFSEQQMHRQFVSGLYAVQAESKTEVPQLPLWSEESIPGTESGTDTAYEIDNTSF
jgi:hypothetical protein